MAHNLSAKEERLLVEACVRNDRRGQEQFYKLFFPAMFRLCLRYTDDRDLALEVLNNGFLRVFQKLHTYSFAGSLEGWVRRVVFHSLASQLGRKPQGVRLLDLEDRDSPVQETALPNLYFEDILHLTDRLPAATREVFWLYAVEGYSHGEISERVGISTGTSKWHLSEARRRLRQLLGESEASTPVPDLKRI